MAATSFVRGSIIFFTAACTDQDGLAATPDSATLHLVFTASDGSRSTAAITMAISANIVTANWDSSVADAKPVRWSIRAAGVDASVTDGDFLLTANEANS